MAANPFDEFDAPAPAANPFDEFDSASEEKRHAAQDAEIRREMAMKPEEYDRHIREKVRAGGYYRPQPGQFGLLSGQVTDAIGLEDEISGIGQFLRRLATSGGSLDEAGKAYTDAAERIRAERRVAREMNGIVPEVVGAIGTVGANAVASAPALVRGFWPTAMQSAKAGAIGGAVSGAAQGEGGVVNRAVDAAKGAGIGAVAGPAISNIAVPAAARLYGGGKAAVQYANRALRSAQQPEQAAIENVADRMVAAGVDPTAVRAAVSPPPSPNLASRGFTDADMADVIARQMAGESADSVARSYAHRVNASGQRPTGNTMRRYYNEYLEGNPTPLNVLDIAQEVAGVGGASPLLRLGRAAYSLAGDESGVAAQRLMGRQDTQPGRVSNIVQRSVAGGDFEATRAAGLQNLRNEADAAYRQFYAEPDLAIDQLGDLLEDPLFRQAMTQGQQRARISAIRRNQEATARGVPQNQLEPIPTVDPEAQVFSPEMLDQIQRQLRITADGHVSNPNAAAHARDLREVFLDRIEQHYPTFRGIRRDYATGMGEFGEEGALEAGRQLTTRLGASTDEALRGFADYTPAQQDLFRLGFARKLMDMAADPQIGGAVANKFNTTAVREIVERLYPQSNRQLWDQGQRLLRDLRRESITTNTKNEALKGARTAELSSDMGRMMEGAQAAADLATGRFGKLIENLSTRLSTQLGQRGAREVLDILTQTDPARLLPLLNRLEQAAQSAAQRQQLVHQLRQLRAASLPGTAAQVGVYAGGQR